MTYRAPVADIAFALKHTAGLKQALAEGLYGEMDGETIDAVLEEAGKFASDVIAPLNAVGDKFGTPFKDGKVTTPPGWKDAYTAWAAAGWNGLAAPSRVRRPGPAARGQRRLHRDVERRLDGLRHRPGADHGGDRRAACLRHRRAQAAVSGEARHRRMDGHDAAHRAAGRLRRRRAAHQGRARRRRQLPPHRLQDLHHLRRARPHRQHHPFRAGAAAGRAGRHQGHLAVPGAEDHARRHAQRRARAFGRAQARHPCLADLHHGLRRQRRRRRLPHRRGTQRHGLHVHDDEPGAARRRPAGRRHRRARDAAGDALCARAQAGRRRHHRALPRRQAHAAHHALAHWLLRARSATPPASRSTARCAARTRRRARRPSSAARC